MKLKKIRYFGRFYEFKGQLGWMPMHKVLFTMVTCPGIVVWVPQKKVKFK